MGANNMDRTIGRQNEKGPILSNVAKVLTEGGEPEKGKRLLQAALSSASFSGHQTVLETLLPVGESASLLSNERQKLREQNRSM
jgi:hypothetical protein